MIVIFAPATGRFRLSRITPCKDAPAPRARICCILTVGRKLKLCLATSFGRDLDLPSFGFKAAPLNGHLVSSRGNVHEDVLALRICSRHRDTLEANQRAR